MDCEDLINALLVIVGIALLIFLGWVVGSSGEVVAQREALVEMCRTNGGVPMTDDGRVLCFNPQVVQEVR